LATGAAKAGPIKMTNSVANLQILNMGLSLNAKKYADPKAGTETIHFESVAKRGPITSRKFIFST
jgi:hypothetical protein